MRLVGLEVPIESYRMPTGVVLEPVQGAAGG